MHSVRFARCSWALLAFVLLVVGWGAFVRATGSGAGCGAHWPVCNGVVLPRAPSLETLIEFSHRVTSGLLLLLVAGWTVWAFRCFPRGHRVRVGAMAGLLFTVGEALVGAAIVLLRHVAMDVSLARAAWTGLHLTNTFLLLGAVSLTTAWASGVGVPRLRTQGVLGQLLAVALLGMLVLGATGAISALGDTLFPARSLAEGLRADASPTAHLLVRLRVVHPALAVLEATLLVVVLCLAALLRPSPRVRRTAAVLGTLVCCQILAGLLNLLLLAPVWLQLLHLALADGVWISAVLLSATALATDAPRLLAPGSVPAPQS